MKIKLTGGRGGGEQPKFSENDKIHFFRFRESVAKIQSIKP